MADRVVLRFRGRMVEKLVTRAAEEGARLFAVRSASPKEAYLTTDARGASIIRQIAERFRLDVTPVSRRGPFSVLLRMRARWTLPAFFALGFALCALFCGRIWVIDVRSDAPGVEAAALAAGARPGIARRELDTRRMETEIAVRAPGAAYVGVRVTGVRLLVEAKAELPEPELYALDAARDLVAGCDGIVLSVRALTGTPSVKAGDAVRRGQVLIRGEEKATDEATRGVCALGEVEARVFFSAEAVGRTRFVEEKKTGRASLSAELRLLDWSMPLLAGESYPREVVTVKRLAVGGLFLPLEITRVTREETAPVEVEADETALREELGREALAKALEKRPANSVLVDKWIEYSMIEGDRIRARASVEARMNIASPRGAGHWEETSWKCSTGRS